MSAAGKEDNAGTDPNLRLRRSDGSEIIVEVRAKAVELRQKQYVQIVSRDITERLKIEARLHEQLDELRRFQKVTVDREIRLQELEKELRRVKSAPPR